MDYELAKQLKDARFRQLGDGYALLLHPQLPESDQTMSRIAWRDFVRIAHSIEDRSTLVYEPTLSELIEGSEDYTNFGLEWRIGKWTAWKEMAVTRESKQYWEARGETPEEAVAHLWLSLNDNL